MGVTWASVSTVCGFIVGACALTFSAVAADGTTELAAGGLIYAGLPHLVTDMEEIVIAADRVRVAYGVRNTSEANVSLLAAFALPDVDMAALDGTPLDNPSYDPANPANYVGFSARADGQLVDLFFESRALALGLIDATDTLKALKLPLYPLSPGLGEQIKALDPATQSMMIARSLVRLADGQFEPFWTLKTTLFWIEPFAPSQTRTLAIEYRPIAGTPHWTEDTASTLKLRYCVPDAVASSLDTRAAQGEPPSLMSVHYLASAGATLRGASAKWKLAVETTGKQSAFSCQVGLAAGGQTGARATTDDDHISEDELQVLFVD